jgi:glycosyltransferase involved in cell wall biosynthesis
MVTLNRPTILMPTRYFIPASNAGGVARSLANLTEELGERFHFVVVTSNVNTDDDGEFLHKVTRVSHAEVHFVSGHQVRLGFLRRFVASHPHDLLYLNSFFDPWFSLLPAYIRASSGSPRAPLLVAPRGELAPSALTIKSLRKRAILRMLDRVQLYGDAQWHASSAYEAEDIRHALASWQTSLRAIHEALNIPAAISGLVQPDPGPHPLRLVTLARVAPLKNLTFAIELIGALGSPVSLDIYGAMENRAYWRQCQRAMAGLPAGASVSYRGPLPPDGVAQTLLKYDLFLLPTKGESFGHAIFEALSVGLPVLISDRTPWRDLEAVGAGFVRPLNRDAFVAALRSFVALDPRQRAIMRVSARAASERVARHEVIETYASMLSKAMGLA